jgi:N-acetyltransferase
MGSEPMLRWGDVMLAPLSLKHVAPLTAIATGDRSSFALTFVPDGEAEVRRYVERAIAEREQGAAVPFAIEHRGAVVGCTRLGHLERWDWPGRAPRPHPDAGEIGWTWLAPSVQGTHVNTASKRLLLGLAFEGWAAQRISFIADVRNLRSRKAIERLGARLDGVLRGHFPAADGSIRDSATYSILAEEWPDVRERLERRLAR